jgi:hypothetical protein
MSAVLPVLSAMALASGAIETDPRVNLDNRSMRFGHTLVTAYTCDLVGYGVDCIGIADLGHGTHGCMVARGSSYNERWSAAWLT